MTSGGDAEKSPLRSVHERKRDFPLFRLATAADVPAIFSIHTNSIRECCSAHYTNDEIAAWVERQSPHKYLPVVQRQCMYVAEERGEVVGFAHLDQGPDEGSGEVVGMYVTPSATQRGIGGQLMCYLERQAISFKGWTRLVVKSTLNAVGFYTSQGFVVISDSVLHTGGDHTLRCVLLEKELTPHPCTDEDTGSN